MLCILPQITKRYIGAQQPFINKYCSKYPYQWRLMQPIYLVHRMSNIATFDGDSEISDIRKAIRTKKYKGHTSGICDRHNQCNLVIVPKMLADEFERYCNANPKPCPLLERLPDGNPIPAIMATNADIRTDLPRYRMYSVDGTFKEVYDIVNDWSDDHVAFLTGCSFSFESALENAGIKLRHVQQKKNVAMFKTNIKTKSSGPFKADMVVSMRPIKRDRINDMYHITAAYDKSHGIPIYAGDPAKIGITNLQTPDWGDAVEVKDDEVPTFWACGVTTQIAVENALNDLEKTKLTSPIITHSPGHMFIADATANSLKNEVPSDYTPPTLGTINSDEEKHSR